MLRPLKCKVLVFNFLLIFFLTSVIAMNEPSKQANYILH